MADGPVAEVQGSAELAKKLKSLKGGGQAVIKAATQAGALIFQNRWKQNIIDYPVVKTGTYLRSVQQEVTEEREGFVEVTVGSDITDPPYPEYLEYGTVKMDARPTARPAFDDTQDEVQQEFMATMRKLLNGN